MRRKLIDADFIECVLGLGPNLFYNSPMEACIVICRASKPKVRKGKILLINAVNEVIRERTQSFLTDQHIARIVDCYKSFFDEPRFSTIVRREDTRDQAGNLNIPLYVNSVSGNGTGNGPLGLSDSLTRWTALASEARVSLNRVLPENLRPGAFPPVRVSRRYSPSWLKRDEWKVVPFGAFADSINARVEPTEAADEVYVGLDDIDPSSMTA